MKYFLLFLLLFISSIFTTTPAQRVGLVLSGGGARGITHIGVIQALEENHIPIDYITGTSMGAIVGAMYAMGHSTQEIIRILKSDDFKRWSTGELDPAYNFYYRVADPKPAVADIHIKINSKDSFSIVPKVLPPNLVPPHQMNFAFIQLFAPATAYINGDFKRLFVPFRSVASDIYNKEAVVFRNGDLGDAVRTSMTFPFVFKPIKVDNRLLFDGGIFNNFPLDVMVDDFIPDYIIGSAVSNNPPKPTEDDVFRQLETMIMNKTDYSLNGHNGTLLKFDLESYMLFDFSKVDELVKIGYDSTIAHIEEIRRAIRRRVTTADVNERRAAFRDNLPDLNFKNIYITGVDSLQKAYVDRSFHKSDEEFGFDEFKNGYFNLISDDKISEVLPKAIYNKNNKTFDLHLNVKTEDQLKVLIGGNVSSTTANQAFFGLVYQDLREYGHTAHIDAQFGRMYNGLSVGSRTDLPMDNIYTKLTGVYHRFNYFDEQRLFFDDDITANFSQNELYANLSLGMPLTLRGRAEYGLGVGYLTDYYRNAVGLEKSEHLIGRLFARWETYTFNSIMYPTAGQHFLLSAQLLGGNENYVAIYNQDLNKTFTPEVWLRIKAVYDKYYRIDKNINIGIFAEAVYSNRSLLSNYSANIIQAPAFRPNVHSQTMFNPAFSAQQYLALGIKPIYNINSQLQWRNEMYWFIPYKTMLRQNIDNTIYSAALQSSSFMAETSVVLNLRIATASIFMNYYSHSNNKFNFGINIGYLLFNNKFLD